MTRPDGDLAAGAGGRGHLRASHADREQVIITLKAAFVQGMLAKDEFDLRVAQTFASRTYAELAAVIDDIPPGLPTTSAEMPSSPGEDGQPVVRPGPVLGAATAAYAAAWAFALSLSTDNSAGPALIVLGGVVYLGVLLICVAAMVALRRERRPPAQPPRRADRGEGGPTSQGFPPGSRDKRLPPGQHGHTYSSQVRWGRASWATLPDGFGFATGAAEAS